MAQELPDREQVELDCKEIGREGYHGDASRMLLLMEQRDEALAALRKTEEKLFRLSFIVTESMEKCRKDFMRQIQDFDYCEVCPLLKHCHAQEHEPNNGGKL